MRENVDPYPILNFQIYPDGIYTEKNYTYTTTGGDIIGFDLFVINKTIGSSYLSSNDENIVYFPTKCDQFMTSVENEENSFE